MWRDRILSILNDEEGSRERAAQLQTALKRDEVTKETYDEFVTFCLGEFSLQIQRLVIIKLTREQLCN